MAFSPYKLETDLCNDFIEHAESNGWIVYPETNDWDIFMVANKVTRNIKLGDQVGIEAKLKPNLKVLSQAYSRSLYYKEAGPDFVCALVPEVTPEFENVSNALGIIPIAMFEKRDDSHIRVVSKFEFSLHKRNRRIYSKKLWVPDVQVAVSAGSAGPRKVTSKKIKMVRHCLYMLDNNGMCTSDSFAENDVGNYRTWLNLKWIKDSGMRVGSKKLWVLNPNSYDRPDRKWPEIVKSIRDVQSGEIH